MQEKSCECDRSLAFADPGHIVCLPGAGDANSQRLFQIQIFFQPVLFLAKTLGQFVPKLFGKRQWGGRKRKIAPMQ